MIDVTRAFWHFVDVMGATDAAGDVDDVMQHAEYQELCDACETCEPLALRPTPPLCVAAAVDDPAWDARCGAYLFGDIDALFRGAERLLPPCQHEASDRLRACVRRITCALDVWRLADGDGGVGRLSVVCALHGT